MTLKDGSGAWTAGKLGEAAQTHLGQAGHSIPVWAALVRIYRWKNYWGRSRGHDGGSIGPNFGIILLAVPFRSYIYRELIPLS